MSEYGTVSYVKEKDSKIMQICLPLIENKVSLKERSIICPNCLNVPSINYILKEEGLIQINCQCGYNESMSPSAYLSKLDTIESQHSKNKIVNSCQKHDNRVFLTYCKTCNQHLCERCDIYGAHKSHERIELLTIKQKIFKTENLKNLEKLTNQILRECNNLKEKYIKKLALIITQIEMSYNLFVKKNQNFIYVMTHVMKNYNEHRPNYHQILNAQLINDLKINYFDQKEDNDNINYNLILNYFSKGFPFELKFNQNIQNMRFKSSLLDSDNKLNPNEQLLISNEIKGELGSISSAVYLSTSYLGVTTLDKTMGFFDLKKINGISKNDKFPPDILIRNAHNTSITDIIELPDTKIATSSYREIRIWELYYGVSTILNREKNIYYNLPSAVPYKLIKIISKAHDNWISKMINLSGDRFGTCSHDKTVKIWEAVTYEENEEGSDINLFSSQSSYKLSSQKSGLKMTDMNFHNRCSSQFSPFKIQQNKIDNPNDYKIIINKKYCQRHEDKKDNKIKDYKLIYRKTNKVEINNLPALDPSNKKCLKQLNNINNYKLMITLDKHENFVNAMIQLKNGNLVSASSNEDMLYFWNLNTYRCAGCIKQVNVSSFKNCLFETIDEKLIVGGVECITLINSKTMEILYILEKNSLKYVYGFYDIGGNSYLCACNFGLIYRIDIFDNKKNYYRVDLDDKHFKKVHEQAITSLVRYDDKCFITCSNDCIIRFVQINF